jgi:hypothetical protein
MLPTEGSGALETLASKQPCSSPLTGLSAASSKKKAVTVHLFISGSVTADLTDFSASIPDRAMG